MNACERVLSGAAIKGRSQVTTSIFCKAPSTPRPIKPRFQTQALGNSLYLALEAHQPPAFYSVYWKGSPKKLPPAKWCLANSFPITPAAEIQPSSSLAQCCHAAKTLRPNKTTLVCKLLTTALYIRAPAESFL